MCPLLCYRQCSFGHFILRYNVSPLGNEFLNDYKYNIVLKYLLNEPVNKNVPFYHSGHYTYKWFSSYVTKLYFTQLLYSNSSCQVQSW